MYLCSIFSSAIHLVHVTVDKLVLRTLRRFIIILFGSATVLTCLARTATVLDLGLSWQTITILRCLFRTSLRALKTGTGRGLRSVEPGRMTRVAQVTRVTRMTRMTRVTRVAGTRTRARSTSVAVHQHHLKHKQWQNTNNEGKNNRKQCQRAQLGLPSSVVVVVETGRALYSDVFYAVLNWGCTLRRRRRRRRRRWR